MKRFLGLCALAGASLWSVSALAVVTDRFECSIVVLDRDGQEGVRTHHDVAIVRLPMSNPDWIEGVRGTDSSSHFEFEDPVVGLKISVGLAYELFVSADRVRAAQYTCLGYSVEVPGEGTATACSATSSTPPYDPVNLLPRTGLSASGNPLFRAEDLSEMSSNIPDNARWSSFRTGCRYVGTFE